MKSWKLIAVAAILTLVGIASFTTPAMAREYHARYAHASARSYPVKGSWYGARRCPDIRRAAPVRVPQARAAHFRGPRRVGHCR